MSNLKETNFKMDRFPKDLKDKMHEIYYNNKVKDVVRYLHPNHIYLGDARELLTQIEPNSIDLSV